MLLRGRQASEHQKETWDGRDGVALACHLRALSWLARFAHRSKGIACSMLSYCLEMNIWGWVENVLISPKTQKRKSARNGYPDLTCVRNIKIFNYQWIWSISSFSSKTPPKVKKEDPLKISFKSLEARMKGDSRPKQKQDTTRYAILINKTNRHNSHVAKVPASSSVKGAVRYIFGASLLPNFITVYLYVEKDYLQMHKHNLHVVTHISSAFK